MQEIPRVLLIILILAAVIAGLWVGSRANDQWESSKQANKGKSLGTRARELSTRAVVSVWKWQRARARSKKEREREGSS